MLRYTGCKYMYSLRVGSRLPSGDVNAQLAKAFARDQWKDSACYVRRYGTRKRATNLQSAACCSRPNTGQTSSKRR
jgi:hypothetical protein